MKRKPRILVVTSTFPRWEKDLEPRFVFDLSRRLTDAFEVHVLAPHIAGAHVHEEMSGLQVHRFRYAPEPFETLAYQGGILARLREHPARTTLIPLFLGAQIIAIRRLLRRYQFDVIHCHWLIPQTLTALLAQIGRSHRIPIVSTSHGADLFGLRGRSLEILKRWILRRCTEVTVVSHAMCEEVRRIAPDRNAQVIPMGTDLTELFTPNGEQSRRSGQLLFVGRLVEKKGVVHLLRAFAIARRTRPDIQLLIAGSGPDERRIRDLADELGISDGVCFLGPISHHDLPRLYREASAAIVPSVVATGGDQEGFGLVIVEAMGCGCPVVVSDLPAVKDIARDQSVAMIVPPGDERQLANAIDAVLGDHDSAAIRAKAAREYVLMHFGWEAITARYAQLLTQQTNNAIH